MCYFKGIKLNDPNSPAYIPSLFSFTAPKKRKSELGLKRYNSAKQRMIHEERQPDNCSFPSEEANECQLAHEHDHEQLMQYR